MKIAAIVSIALLSFSLGGCIVSPWGYDRGHERGGEREYRGDQDRGERGDQDRGRGNR